MSVISRVKTFFLLLFFLSPAVNAATYIAFAPAQLKIKTSSGSTKPSVSDFRFGYQTGVHKFELAYMTSINDDNLNELVTDIPSVTSLFYRYDGNPAGDVKLEIILGYSQVEIDTTYVNEPAFNEKIEGFSYGVGLEEALQSIPQLKFRVDFIQMYKGDNLELKLFSVGLRYEF